MGGVKINDIGWYNSNDNLITQTNKTYSKNLDIYFTSLKNIFVVFHQVSDRLATTRYLSNLFFLI